MSPDAIRRLDGGALTKLAWELALDPRGLTGWRVFSWQQRSWGEAAMDASGHIWRPHARVDQAYALFTSLRTRGFTTSSCWFADDRQYGEAWVSAGAQPRTWAVQWPRERGTEAEALVLVSVLAVRALRDVQEPAS